MVHTRRTLRSEARFSKEDFLHTRTSLFFSGLQVWNNFPEVYSRSSLIKVIIRDRNKSCIFLWTGMGAVGPSLSATGKTISVFQRRSRKCFQVKRQCFYVAGSNLRPLKPMPSSRWGIGRFCLSESKCTVSARILHGFKTCKGCFSLQNTTKSAEIAGQKITLPCSKITMTRNFQKLRRTGGLLS